MIRGVQKNVIQIQTPKSPYFETACFIMRATPQKPAAGATEMLSEARRILEETAAGHEKKPSKRNWRRILFSFAWGLLIGAGSVGGLWLWSILMG